MSLSTCIRCGATLTDMFRFCPACGLSNDDDGWVLPPEPKAPLSFPMVERPRPARDPRRVPRLRLPTVAPAARRLSSRLSAFPNRFLSRLGARARRLATGTGETARLLIEAVLVIVASALGGLRLMVVLRKLHAQRAAVIYSTGCAALNGDERRVRHARAEVQVLDELITAAATGALSDVPTRETVRR